MASRTVSKAEKIITCIYSKPQKIFRSFAKISQARDKERAVRHRQLLAGSGCAGRKSVQCHHRQAAVRGAEPPTDRRTHRTTERTGTQPVLFIPTPHGDYQV